MKNTNINMGNLVSGISNWVVQTIAAAVLGFAFDSIIIPVLDIYKGGASLIVYEVLKATYPIPLKEEILGGIYGLGYTSIGFFQKIYNLFRDNVLGLFLSLINPTFFWSTVNSVLGLILGQIQSSQTNARYLVDANENTTYDDEEITRRCYLLLWNEIMNPGHQGEDIEKCRRYFYQETWDPFSDFMDSLFNMVF